MEHGPNTNDSAEISRDRIPAAPVMQGTRSLGSAPLSCRFPNFTDDKEFSRQRLWCGRDAAETHQNIPVPPGIYRNVQITARPQLRQAAAEFRRPGPVMQGTRSLEFALLSNRSPWKTAEDLYERHGWDPVLLLEALVVRHARSSSTEVDHVSCPKFQAPHVVFSGAPSSRLPKDEKKQQDG